MKDLLNSPYARIVDTPAIIRSLVRISLLGSLLIGIVFWFGNGIQETSLSLFIVTIICFGLLLLQNRGYYQISGLLLYLVISFILTFNISIGHAIYDEAMLAYPILIIFSGLIFGKRSAIVVTGITIFQLILIFILAQAGHVQAFGGAVSVTLEETITTLIILIATGFLVWVVIDIIENAVERISKSESDLENAYNLTLSAWAKALELRGREDPGHSGRVTALSTMLAEQMQLDPLSIKQIRQGALLHDIGKMGIPEKILLKTKPFDAAEKETLKEHTILAREIIDDIDYLNGALEIISHHHERYDGTGYPDQLKANEIPIKSQIFSIVDHWDILRNDRPCRKAWSDRQALDYILDQSGEKFNPDIVEIFSKMVGEVALEEEE